MVDGCTEVGGVPGDGGVGEQGEALGSDVLVVGSASVESAVVGEEQLTAEGVEGFALQTDAFCTFTRPTPSPTPTQATPVSSNGAPLRCGGSPLSY